MANKICTASYNRTMMVSAPKSQQNMCKLHLQQMEVLYTTSIKDADISTIRQEIEVLKSDFLADCNIHLPLPKIQYLPNCLLVIKCTTNNLMFEISDASQTVICACSISVAALTRAISDYLKICDSYKLALKEGGQARLEAIDMGRRGLHNDAAKDLIALLEPHLYIDFATARQLFALLSTIHRSA